MIHSMTGFARHELVLEDHTWSFEIKSVNHRYFEFSCKLPEDRRSLETGIRSHVASLVRRGKIDLWITLRPNQKSAPKTRIDTESISHFIEIVKTFQAEAGRQGMDVASPNAIEGLRWPGVLKEPELNVVLSEEKILSELTHLIGQFNQHRASEGARLTDFLLTRIAQLEQLVLSVRTHLPDIHSKLRARLLERLQTLSADIKYQADRFEQELVIQLQKMDVEEELNRLSGHCAEIKKALSSEEAAGRRLDFLMQELNREANTLSSKSADAETTRLAVEMKVLIEQMREQVQNVE